jgi:hypothetical protein
MLIFMTAELQIRQDGKKYLGFFLRGAGRRALRTRHLCEERSDVAIQRTWYDILDCHVATLLAMTGEGATQDGACAERGGCVYQRDSDIQTA